jgi:hypothetical protein
MYKQAPVCQGVTAGDETAFLSENSDRHQTAKVLAV